MSVVSATKIEYESERTSNYSIYSSLHLIYSKYTIGIALVLLNLLCFHECSHHQQIFSHSITTGPFNCKHHWHQHNQQQQQQNEQHQSFLTVKSLARTTYHHDSKKRRSVVMAGTQLHKKSQQISLLTNNEAQIGLHSSPTASVTGTTFKDGPVAEVIAIKEGADLELACPINIRSHNDDMIFSWTCGDEPANIRSSRIYVTDSGKLRIRSARLGDSCNYRCEAVEGFGTVSVMVKVIIVDKKIIEQHFNKTTSSEIASPASEQVESVQANEKGGQKKSIEWAHSSTTIESASSKLREIKPIVNQVHFSSNNDRSNKDNEDRGTDTNISSSNNNKTFNINDTDHQQLLGRAPITHAPRVLQLFALTKNLESVSRDQYPSIKMVIRGEGSLILGCKFQANPWPDNVRWSKDGLELPTQRTILASRSSNGSSVMTNQPQQHHHHYERYLFYNLTTDLTLMANKSMPLNYSCRVSNYLGESSGNFLINILPTISIKIDGTIKQQQPPSNNYSNNGNGSNYSRKVQLTPAFSYAEANTTIRLECSCNYSTLAPQIQWLKEYTGPRPQSLADAHNMGLIYLEGAYYHNLNWPRIISYQGKSFNSILVIKRAKSTHSGRYLCFAAYPPLNEPLRYHSASSQVFINDDKGNLISNGGENYLPIVTDQQQRSHLMQLVKSNSWESNNESPTMLMDKMNFISSTDRKGYMAGLIMKARWPWWLVTCIVVTILAIGFIIVSKRYSQGQNRAKDSHHQSNQEEQLESTA